MINHRGLNEHTSSAVSYDRLIVPTDGNRGRQGERENTVNREIFVVKILSDRLISTKIKRTKIVRIIIANAVRGRLSENENLIVLIRNIRDLWYIIPMFPLSPQMDADNAPTDNLDPLALSIMQEIGSAARTVTEACEDPLVNQYITSGMNS
jgi:hypothetical protein